MLFYYTSLLYLRGVKQTWQLGGIRSMFKKDAL